MQNLKLNFKGGELFPIMGLYTAFTKSNCISIEIHRYESDKSIEVTIMARAEKDINLLCFYLGAVLASDNFIREEE